MQFLCRFHRHLDRQLYVQSLRSASKLSFLPNNPTIPSHGSQSIRSLVYYQTSSFSSTSKDDSSSKETTQSSDDSVPSESTKEGAGSTSETGTSTTSTPSPESTESGSATTSGPVPLIRIHDENSPQLSISLPNRWPFKRLARPPKEETESLNLHEMSRISTFSGLPAQNFLPSEAEKARAAEVKAKEESKSEEEKRREARKSFWKRFSMVMMATPMIMYIRDNRKAKALARRRAEYVSSASSDDARNIRDMAQLNNAELMDLYKWMLHEECDDDPDGELTVDQFGELVVRAVDIFKQRKVEWF